MIRLTKIENGVHFSPAYRITFRYDPVTVGKVKTLTERRYLPDDRAWEIPERVLSEVLETFNGEVEAVGEFTKELKDKAVQDQKEAVRERLRGIKPCIEFDFKTDPLPHQIEAFNRGVTSSSLLLGDQQGLGKTKESIDIVIAQKEKVHKCLIVCGVNSVKYNWVDEIKKHSNESCIMIDAKTMPKRALQINDWYTSSHFFAVINIESLRKECIQDAIYIGVRDGIIGATIVDEIHKAKNGQSQQGKALRVLRTPIKLGLTGTPIMNRAEDLWNILVWLGAEKRNFWQFRKAYCVMGGYGGYNVVGYKNLDSLNALLNEVMLRRKKDEVLDLPPKLHQKEYVELTQEQRNLYRDIRNGIIEELEDILTSVNPLTCTLRLRQLTGGLFFEANPKLDRIQEMLEEDIIPNNEKAIIFSQWEKVANLYKRHLKKYNPAYITGEVDAEARQAEVNRFQTDPECKVAIGTIGAMGTGLTLNRASYVFFVDKSWVAAENEQAEDRAHRIGTQGTVTVISMLAKGTIDERVEDYLLEKKDLFERVVDGKGTTTDYKALLNKLLQIDT